MKSTVTECPIEEAMVLLGGRWPTLLLYYLQGGTRRFNALRRDLATISHRMLTLELRKLEQAGVVARTAYAGYPSRVEYTLTPAGQRLLPLIDALGEWWTATTNERASRVVGARVPSEAAALPQPTNAHIPTRKDRRTSLQAASVLLRHG